MRLRQLLAASPGVRQLRMAGGWRSVRPSIATVTLVVALPIWFAAFAALDHISQRMARSAATHHLTVMVEATLSAVDGLARHHAADLDALADNVRAQGLPKAARRMVIWSGADVVVEVLGHYPGSALARPAGVAGSAEVGDDLCAWRPVGDHGMLAALCLDGGRAFNAAVSYSTKRTAVGLGIAFVGLLAVCAIVSWQLRLVRRAARSAGPADAATTEVPAPRWEPREAALVRGALRRAIDGWQAERAARQRHERIARAVSEFSREGFMLFNMNGVILAANPSAQRILAAPESGLRGMRVHDRLTDADARRLDLALGILRNDGRLPMGGQEFEQSFVLPDGAQVPVRCVLRLLDGHERTVELHLEDLRGERQRITECGMALQQAQDAVVAKQRLLATVSHEIRTPLGGLTGMLDLLRQRNLDDDQKEVVATMRSCVRLMRLLVNDLLDLSKIESGKLELESIPFDVHDQVHRSVTAHKAAAEARGIALTITSHTPERMLMGDPHRIAQVLHNLVDNALKFTAQGQVEVHVRTLVAEPDDEDCKVWISVRDTGPGIASDRLARIFEPYEQADESVARTHGGTGLGLTLCRQLCRAMGGDVGVESGLGHGSVFTVFLRLPRAHGMSPFADTAPYDSLERSKHHGTRVLVADDNLINQKLLRRWLEQEGMDVTCVDNGEDAVHAVSQGSYDLVMMDVSMPVMNGIDASRAIRSLAAPALHTSPRVSAIPIIGVTARAMDGDRTACLEAGMNDCVTKPVDRREMMDAIERELDRSGPRAAMAKVSTR